VELSESGKRLSNSIGALTAIATLERKTNFFDFGQRKMSLHFLDGCVWATLLSGFLNPVDAHMSAMAPLNLDERSEGEILAVFRPDSRCFRERGGDLRADAAIESSFHFREHHRTSVGLFSPEFSLFTVRDQFTM